MNCIDPQSFSLTAFISFGLGVTASHNCRGQIWGSVVLLGDFGNTFCHTFFELGHERLDNPRPLVLQLFLPISGFIISLLIAITSLVLIGTGVGNFPLIKERLFLLIGKQSKVLAVKPEGVVASDLFAIL